MKNVPEHSEDPCAALAVSLRNRGIVSFGFLGGEALARLAEGLSGETAGSYGLAAARGAVVAAFPYDTTGTPAGALDPRRSRDSSGRLIGDLGWFARSNWYRELVRLLGAVVEDVRGIGSWSRSDFRVAVNSRLPEKPLAAAAGLGPVGRNTLLLDRVLGSGCVLGVLLLPFEPDSSVLAGAEPAFAPGSDCGCCDACVRACPTGAIRPDGGIERELCLQYWASTDSPVPCDIAKLWRGSLYGCDLCQAACPRFRSGVERIGRFGVLGAGLPLDVVLLTPDIELRAFLKGTALGLSWITPALLRRNALLALSSRLSREGPGAFAETTRKIRDAVERMAAAVDPSLASAAVMALSAFGIRTV